MFLISFGGVQAAQVDLVWGSLHSCEGRRAQGGGQCGRCGRAGGPARPAHTPVPRLLFQRRNFTLAFQAAESVGIKSTLVSPCPEALRQPGTPSGGCGRPPTVHPVPYTEHPGRALSWGGQGHRRRRTPTARPVPQWRAGPGAQGARGRPAQGRLSCGGCCLISRSDFKGENAASKCKACPCTRDTQLSVSTE